MVREVDYKSLSEKNRVGREAQEKKDKELAEKGKRVKEFGYRKGIATKARDQAKYWQIGYKINSNGDLDREYAYALSLLNNQISDSTSQKYNGGIFAAYNMFDTIESSFDSPGIKEGIKKGDISKDLINKYKKALARRGERLVKAAYQKNIYNEKNEKILKYCNEVLGSHPSGLEKTITVVSALSIVLGIAIGYPSLTGNVIAGTLKGSLGYGAILFGLGLVGVFLANKK